MRKDTLLLRRIAARIARRPAEALVPSDSLRGVLGLDTLDLLRLVAEAEDAYGVTLGDDTLAGLVSWGDLVAAFGIEG